MNTIPHQEPYYEIVDTLQSMMKSSDAMASILSQAIEDILKIHAGPGTEWITDTVPSLALPYSPTGSLQVLWQFPRLYHAHSRGMVKAMVDSCAIMSRAQQLLLELAGESLSDKVQQTTQAMTQLSGVLASRRISAEVISFSDRRATLQAVSDAVAAASSEADRQAAQRAGRPTTN